MQMDPIVFKRIRPVEPVPDLYVHEEQEKFVGTLADIFANATESDHLHLIQIGGTTVGFFIVDVAYSDTYTFAHPTEVGLRAFFLDTRHQGKGYCTRAISALSIYLEREYPRFNGIVLTVNCANPPAIACYEKGGFSFTGEKYYGGAAGPQYIMRMIFRD